MNNNSLKLKIIWKDDDMFEIRVSSNNGRYSGVTEVYETKESLLSFAESLKNFPINNQKLSHSCGKKDSYAFFEMSFHPIGLNGITGVQITLEENVASEFRKEEKDKLVMELIVEPTSIDRFQNELEKLSINEEGVAELIAIKKYSNNVN